MEYKCKKCGGDNIVLVEYGVGPYRYDGISEIECVDVKCGARYGRWSGKELEKGEQEPPYGDMKYITNKSKHYNI